MGLLLVSIAYDNTLCLITTLPTPNSPFPTPHSLKNITKSIDIFNREDSAVAAEYCIGKNRLSFL